jgi:hypothetical protein
MTDDKMASKFSKETSEGKPQGGPKAPPREVQPEQAPVARERRSSHRVADDQKTGQGSLSALSKMRMIERRRAVMSPRQKEPGDEGPD